MLNWLTIHSAIPEVQSPNSRTQSSDTLPRPRAGTKHSIPSEPQPEAKRGKCRNSTSCSSPDLQRNTRTPAPVATSKDNTPKLVQQEAEEIQCTGGESSYYGQYLQDWPKSANRSLCTDTMINSIPDPQGSEQISDVRIIDMLALLKLDCAFTYPYLSLTY
jgi:hypothetical protein